MLEANTTAHKFGVAIVTALVAAGALVSDGVISVQDIITIIVAFAGALGVYAVPNKPVR